MSDRARYIFSDILRALQKVGVFIKRLSLNKLVTTIGLLVSAFSAYAAWQATNMVAQQNALLADAGSPRVFVSTYTETISHESTPGASFTFPCILPQTGDAIWAEIVALKVVDITNEGGRPTTLTNINQTFSPEYPNLHITSTMRFFATEDEYNNYQEGRFLSFYDNVTVTSLPGVRLDFRGDGWTFTPIPIRIESGETIRLPVLSELTIWADAGTDLTQLPQLIADNPLREQINFYFGGNTLIVQERYPQQIIELINIMAQLDESEECAIG